MNSKDSQSSPVTKFTVTFPPEMNEWLTAQAERMNISKNSVIRMHLSDAMHKSNN